MARPRGDASAADELVARLNSMVAQLVSTNRRLQREVERLTERVGAGRKPRAAAARSARPARTAARSTRRPVQRAKKRAAPAKPSRKPAPPSRRTAKAATRKRRR